ncbi:TonB-dependent receptor plug domain-containing protein [Ferruginibacter sp.]
MKYSILLLITFFCITTAQSQSIIRGKILSADKTPIGAATIRLVSTESSTTQVADHNGIYQITGLKKITYQITVSAIGFESSSRDVEIVNDIEEFDFVLSPAALQLQKVEVVGRSARKYTSDYSFGATRTATLNKDLSQTLNTVTKELMADRQAFQLADAVKVIPGVIPSSYYNQYSIRGISQNEEGQIINGMRTRQYYFLQPVTSNIERVEVIKGPASATFASVDPGGSINMVTKKPLADSRKEINLSVGSFSTIRATIDFTGPLNKKKPCFTGLTEHTRKPEVSATW